MPAIVDAQWLGGSLEATDLVVVDTRPEEDFLLGHVRGAVNVPYPRLFAEGYLMPGLDALRALMSEAGIGAGRRVVLYDDGSFIWAARAYWLLETLGHDQVALLDVGFDEWFRGGFPVDFEAAPVQRRDFVPTVDPRRVETKLSTRMAIDSRDRVIVDGRSRKEYLGLESHAARFGHIPGALHFPWTHNYAQTQSGNRMLSLERLGEVYADLDPDKHVIVYCNGGAQSALNYVVLQALGYSVSVYDGSWFEWGNDPALPVFNPSAP